MNDELETERLLLRKPQRNDIPAIVTQLGDWDVAKTLGRVPHPYSDDDASEFFDRMETRATEQPDLTFGVTLKAGGTYIGGCGVHLRENEEFELGYWIGKPHWGHGYATEAAGAVTRAAFALFALERLTAGWFEDNPASGRVLEKLGFVPDGEEMRECRARGCEVRCHAMLLTREVFAGKHAA
jgi:[ribosomal protein S5]-alanine N-acetyltransferase